jgi:hypothetical protein
VSGTGVTVTWTEPSAAQKGTDSGVTYDVRYRVVPTWVETAWITKNVSNSLSYTVTGLPINTSFELQVRTRTGLGAGPWSTVKTFKTAGVPGVVRSVATSVRSTGIKVSWSAPSSNGGSAVTGYVVSYRKSGGSWATVYPSSTYVDLTKLSGGVKYEITVKARNAVGQGPAATITATSISGPSAPTSVKAARGNASAKVTWAAPTNTGGTAVTGYTVQLRSYSSSWSAWATKVNAGASVRSASLTSLVNGRKYEVRVLAKNAVATGSASAAVGFVPATKPGVPKKVKASSLTKKIKVSWAKPSTNGSTLKGYTIRYSADRKNWKTLKTITSPSTLSYTWKATKRKKAYFFEVKANSNLGSSKYSSYVLGVAK